LLLSTALQVCQKWTYFSVYNLAMVSGREMCDMSKVSECCTEKAQLA